MKEMTPPFVEPKFFEHARYAEFLNSLGTRVGDWNLALTDHQKQGEFFRWLRAQEDYKTHEKYGDFLVSLNRKALNYMLYEATPEQKQEEFTRWLKAQEVAADFKDLIPMRIVMNAEEFEWFKAKIEADEEAHIPNLRALAKHPPKGAI